MTQSPRRILAVDYGDARTGLAATDWTGTIVVPLPRIDAREMPVVAAAIAAVVKERDTELVVIGMPLSQDGAAGPRAQRTGAFQKLLQKALGCPVTAVDESHSTDEAHELLKSGGMKAAKRKQFADSIAALVILERFRSTVRRQP